MKQITLLALIVLVISCNNTGDPGDRYTGITQEVRPGSNETLWDIDTKVISARADSSDQIVEWERLRTVLAADTAVWKDHDMQDAIDEKYKIDNP